MSNADLINMYSRSQQGGELPYFVGKQTGSGWFRALGRFAIPILRKLGLSAAKAATGALAATATDVLTGKKQFVPSLKQNTMSAVNETLPVIRREATHVIDSLAGQKRTKHRTKGINKRRKVTGTIFNK